LWLLGVFWIENGRKHLVVARFFWIGNPRKHMVVAKHFLAFSIQKMPSSHQAFFGWEFLVNSWQLPNIF
jgi:hypothetical protein